MATPRTRPPSPHNFCLISPAKMRAMIESHNVNDESLTATVARLAPEIGVTPRTLWNYLDRGVTLALPDSTAKTLKFLGVNESP